MAGEARPGKHIWHREENELYGGLCWRCIKCGWREGYAIYPTVDFGGGCPQPDWEEPVV